MGACASRPRSGRADSRAALKETAPSSLGAFLLNLPDSGVPVSAASSSVTTSPRRSTSHRNEQSHGALCPGDNTDGYKEHGSTENVCKHRSPWPSAPCALEVVAPSALRAAVASKQPRSRPSTDTAHQEYLPPTSVDTVLITSAVRRGFTSPVVLGPAGAHNDALNMRVTAAMGALTDGASSATSAAAACSADAGAATAASRSQRQRHGQRHPRDSAGVDDYEGACASGTAAAAVVACGAASAPASADGAGEPPPVPPAAAPVQWVLRPGPPLERDYEVGGVLGQGSYGVVRAAAARTGGGGSGGGGAVAVKTIRKTAALTGNPAAVAALRREVEILHHLAGHPQIGQLLGAYEEPTQLHLVMELYEGGDLYDAVVGIGRHSERAAADVMRAVLTALGYCHAMGVAHRDVKPENFMLAAPSAGASKQQETAGAAAANGDGASGGGDDSGVGSRLKLIDFGLSCFCNDAAPLTEPVGTSYYVAPEVLEGGGYGRAADVWSAGVILHVLLLGYAPFNGADDTAIQTAVLKGVPDSTGDPLWSSLSAAAVDVLAAMLDKNPVTRATASQLLSSSWLGRTAADCAAPSQPLPGVVSERLRRFARLNSLQKEARRLVAGAMHEEEVAGLRATFRALDADGDGKLSAAELREGFARREAPLGAPVGAEELGPLAPSPRGQLLLRFNEARELVARSDLDGDGLLDESEFLGAALPAAAIQRAAAAELAAATEVAAAAPRGCVPPPSAAAAAAAQRRRWSAHVGEGSGDRCRSQLSRAGGAAAAVPGSAPASTSAAAPTSAPAGARAGALTTSPLAAAFAALDADGSGYITADELRLSLAAHHPGAVGPDVRALLATADADADGRISYTEFLAMLLTAETEWEGAAAAAAAGGRAAVAGSGRGGRAETAGADAEVGSRGARARGLGGAAAAAAAASGGGSGRRRGAATAAWVAGRGSVHGHCHGRGWSVGAAASVAAAVIAGAAGVPSTGSQPGASCSSAAAAAAALKAAAEQQSAADSSRSLCGGLIGGRISSSSSSSSGSGSGSSRRGSGRRGNGGGGRRSFGRGFSVTAVRQYSGSVSPVEWCEEAEEAAEAELTAAATAAAGSNRKGAAAANATVEWMMSADMEESRGGAGSGKGGAGGAARGGGGGQRRSSSGDGGGGAAGSGRLLRLSPLGANAPHSPRAFGAAAASEVSASRASGVAAKADAPGGGGGGGPSLAIVRAAQAAAAALMEGGGKGGSGRASDRASLFGDFSQLAAAAAAPNGGSGGGGVSRAAAKPPLAPLSLTALPQQPQQDGSGRGRRLSAAAVHDVSGRGGAGVGVGVSVPFGRGSTNGSVGGAAGGSRLERGRPSGCWVEEALPPSAPLAAATAAINSCTLRHQGAGGVAVGSGRRTSGGRNGSGGGGGGDSLGFHSTPASPRLPSTGAIKLQLQPPPAPSPLLLPHQQQQVHHRVLSQSHSCRPAYGGSPLLPASPAGACPGPFRAPFSASAEPPMQGGGGGSSRVGSRQLSRGNAYGGAGTPFPASADQFASRAASRQLSCGGGGSSGVPGGVINSGGGGGGSSARRQLHVLMLKDLEVAQMKPGPALLSPGSKTRSLAASASGIAATAAAAAVSGLRLDLPPSSGGGDGPFGGRSPASLRASFSRFGGGSGSEEGGSDADADGADARAAGSPFGGGGASSGGGAGAGAGSMSPAAVAMARYRRRSTGSPAWQQLQLQLPPGGLRNAGGAAATTPPQVQLTSMSPRALQHMQQPCILPAGSSPRQQQSRQLSELGFELTLSSRLPSASCSGRPVSTRRTTPSLVDGGGLTPSTALLREWNLVETLEEGKNEGHDGDEDEDAGDPLAGLLDSLPPASTERDGGGGSSWLMFSGRRGGGGGGGGGFAHLDSPASSGTNGGGGGGGSNGGGGGGGRREVPYGPGPVSGDVPIQPASYSEPLYVMKGGRAGGAAGGGGGGAAAAAASAAARW